MNSEKMTMMTKVDIWRSAKLMIDQYGHRASIHAAMRADAMLDAGDHDRQAT